MNSLYLALAMLHFAEGLIAVFVPIYFWGLGFPLWKILFFYFLRSFYFVIFTPALLPLLKKISDKMMMFLSIPFLIIYYYGLGLVGSFGFVFYLLPALNALDMFFFNIGYHLSFAVSADDGYVGREVGTRYMFATLTKFSAPFMGGILITFFGFENTFLVGAAILFLAVIPLLFFPHRNVSPHLDIRAIFKYLKNKTLMPFNISGIGFAAEKMVDIIVWPIFIFLAVGSIANFGGVISASLLASAIITYLVGYLSDVGKRRRTLAVSAYLYSLVWFMRPFFQGAFFIVGSHVLGQSIRSSLLVSWGSQYYKIARSIDRLSLFILSREFLYNLSRAIFIPFLMLLSYILPTAVFFKVSFVIAGITALLFLFANKVHTRDLKDGFLAR